MRLCQAPELTAISLSSGCEAQDAGVYALLPSKCSPSFHIAGSITDVSQIRQRLSRGGHEQH